MLWIIKAVALILAMFHPFPAAIGLLLDGWFHANLDQEQLERESPDHVIARHFDRKGLPLWVHWIMGWGLLAISLWSLWNVHGDRSSKELVAIDRFIAPFTLTIIATAIILKGVYGEEGRTAFL